MRDLNACLHRRSQIGLSSPLILGRDKNVILAFLYFLASPCDPHNKSTISKHWTFPFHLPVSWPLIPTDTGTGKECPSLGLGLENSWLLSFLGSAFQAYIIQATPSRLLLHLCSSASGASHPGMAMPK